MENIKKYKYHYRPEYKSRKYLIEIFSGVEDKRFVSELFDSIKEINPKITGFEDLWMNDEVVFIVDSSLGKFSLSKDIWNLAFIMEEDNPECIERINAILMKDLRFEKVEVNPDNYK